MRVRAVQGEMDNRWAPVCPLSGGGVVTTCPKVLANLVAAIGEWIALYRTSCGWMLMLNTRRRPDPRRCALGSVVRT